MEIEDRYGISDEMRGDPNMAAKQGDTYIFKGKLTDEELEVLRNAPSGEIIYVPNLAPQWLPEPPKE